MSDMTQDPLHTFKRLRETKHPFVLKDIEVFAFLSGDVYIIEPDQYMVATSSGFFSKVSVSEDGFKAPFTYKLIQFYDFDQAIQTIKKYPKEGISYLHFLMSAESSLRPRVRDRVERNFGLLTLKDDGSYTRTWTTYDEAVS